VIVGYITVGTGGMKLLPRENPRPGERADTRRTDVELMLSPRLYVCADEEIVWPDPTARQLVARVGRRRYITAEAVLDRAQELHGGPKTVSLIPAADDFSAKPNRSMNRPHRRHRFYAPRSRARHLLFAFGCLLCAASVAACLVTGQSAQTAKAEFEATESAVAIATNHANRVVELHREVEALQQSIARLDQYVSVPPATLIGAIVATLPATISVQQVSIGEDRFIVDARGDTLLPAAQALETLPMVTDVTVQSRSEGNGLVFGQIRGRLGP